jgi:sarcosine oxidase subunit alpha
VVIATGRNEGSPAFEGSDKPGVVTARGASIMLAHGLLVGQRVVLAGEGAAIEALASALKKAGAEVIGPIAERAVRRARGRPSVTSCELEGGERHECDAIVVGPPTSAVFELAAQAGVRVTFSGMGYELEADADGRTAAPDVRVIGGAAGVGSLEEALAQAERAARSIAEELAR